jgi:tetratricopeptide (TPR) repeat protein
VVDDIVVVDTGSQDDSPRIAETFNARVFAFTWNDDFAAARNYALDQVRSDWVLYIDADERARGITREALRAQVADNRIVAATVRFRPRTGFTAYPEHRLFRCDPRIRFVGAIHETMLPSIHALVAAGSGRIGGTGLSIDHVGYDGDQSHKLDRNERLLRKQIAVDPERPYLWWHLGTVERDRGRSAEAEATWLQGAALVRTRTAPQHEDALCFIELAKSRLERGDDAHALLEEAERMWPGNLMLQWLKAKALVAQGRDADALAVFEPLSRIDPDSLIAPMAYDRRLFGAAAFAEMGHCAFRLGRLEDSARYYRLSAAAGTAVGQHAA